MAESKVQARWEPLQPLRVSGFKLIEIKNVKFTDPKMRILKHVLTLEVTEQRIGSIDPESFKSLKILHGDPDFVVGYIERAWKQEGWWLADLVLFAEVSLGFKVTGEHLEPNEARFQIIPPSHSHQELQGD